MSAVEFWLFLSSLADGNILLLASVISVTYLLWIKEHKKAIFFFAAYAGGIILNKILKEIFQIPRPDNPLVPIEGYGFPSGHAMSAAIFYSLLIILFYKKIKNKKIRIAFVSINVLLIFLVGLSRIMLKVHSPTDVIGGYIFGLLWLSLVYKFLEKFTGF